jgi:ribosomal protein S18 acetylase RimI-like enzyme
VEIRPARPDDAAAVAAVHTRSWQGAYEHVFGAERLAAIDLARRQALAEQAIASGGVAVAEQDGRTVGFVSVGPSSDVEGEGELFAIYVLPEAWGSGAGHALMDAGKDLLRASYSDATLYVLVDNPRARRFYEREGWALDGTRKTGEFLGMSVAEVRYRISFGGTDRA